MPLGARGVVAAAVRTGTGTGVAVRDRGRVVVVDGAQARAQPRRPPPAAAGARTDRAQGKAVGAAIGVEAEADKANHRVDSDPDNPVHRETGVHDKMLDRSPTLPRGQDRALVGREIVSSGQRQSWLAQKPFQTVLKRSPTRSEPW